MTLTCVFCSGAKCAQCSFKGTVDYREETPDLMSWYRVFQGRHVKEVVSRDFFVKKTGLTQYAAYVDSATW